MKNDTEIVREWCNLNKILPGDCFQYEEKFYMQILKRDLSYAQVNLETGESVQISLDEMVYPIDLRFCRND